MTAATLFLVVLLVGVVGAALLALPPRESDRRESPTTADPDPARPVGVAMQPRIASGPPLPRVVASYRTRAEAEARAARSSRPLKVRHRRRKHYKAVWQVVR